MLDHLKNDENKADVIVPIVSKYHENKNNGRVRPEPFA